MGHIEKNFATKESELVRYLAAIRRMEKHFVGFMLRHIPRAKNVEADELAKAATHNVQLPPDVLFQVLTAKSIKDKEGHLVAVHAITSEDRRSPIFAFLTRSYNQTTKQEMERMNAKTKLFLVIGS